jgi:hypothetical protein
MALSHEALDRLARALAELLAKQRAEARRRARLREGEPCRPR